MQSGHHLDKKTLILSAGALLLIPPALLALYKSLNTKPGPPQPDARSSFATVSATEPRESLVNSLSLEDNASWAVIELGGTSIRVAIAKKVYKQGKLVEVTISDRQVFKTKDPAENVQEIAAYLKSKNFEKLGIASFGPVCLNEFDPSFGYITFTPKKTWQHFPILPELRSNLSSSLRESKMDTDVNASAIAEFLLGDHNVKDSIAYITVGTGIGVGLIINGRTVHGAMHPEGGHIRVKIHEKDAGFKGVCPFHEDCVEGLCTNYAIAERLGVSIDELEHQGDDLQLWDIVAFYLAQLCLNIMCITSPEAIVLGGGVMNRSILYGKVRAEFERLNNGYVNCPKVNDADRYIRRPTLGDNSGMIGATLLQKMRCKYGKHLRIFVIKYPQKNLTST